MNRKCSPTTFPHSSALLPKVGWGMSSPGAVLDPQNLVIYTWCTIEQVSMLLIRCPQTVFLNCMAWKWCYRYPHGPWQKKVPYSCKSNQINIFLYILPDISTLYQFQTKTSISIHSLFFSTSIILTKLLLNIISSVKETISLHLWLWPPTKNMLPV